MQRKRPLEYYRVIEEENIGISLPLELQIMAETYEFNFHSLDFVNSEGDFMLCGSIRVSEYVAEFLYDSASRSHLIERSHEGTFEWLSGYFDYHRIFEQASRYVEQNFLFPFEKVSSKGRGVLAVSGRATDYGLTVPQMVGAMRQDLRIIMFGAWPDEPDIRLGFDED